MLAEDTPHFAELGPGRVGRRGPTTASQLPSIVGPTLVAAAYAVSDLYASVPPLSWQRRGVRSDGSEFTVETLGRYHLHDVVHHLHDVRDGGRGGDGPGVRRLRGGLPRRHGRPARRRAPRRSVASPAVLPPGARVLEIGSGPGRDARGARGGRAARSGVPTSRPRFVELLRADGVRRRRARPAHRRPGRPGRARHAVRRGVGQRLPAARRAATTCRPCSAGSPTATATGGLLYASLKEGDGEGWSVARPRRRRRGYFTYWREEPLRDGARGGGLVGGARRARRRARAASRGSRSWRRDR